ncbi:Retrovirus-related Pol polyprotein from transposon RE1 [Cardamine amara subsp. amara]|uniref:Retrovirus-related Pol polyprotein from transposon RE1 n=1 Tax=Cardamine amara subsp. amara TaxID=228776 RepID=A0ABD1C2U8_CARAN
MGSYVVFLCQHPISWSAKKQTRVARSSTEAEYRAVANTAAEVRWLHFLLQELGLKSKTTPVIYCDNVEATYLSANSVFHTCMKHLALNYHFIHDLVQSGRLRVTHVSSKDQLADGLTKPLPRPQFEHLFTKIGLTTRASS